VSVVAHVQKRGDRWQARYRAPDGRERTKRFDRKVDAQRWLATVEADKARGTYVDPEAGKRTFADYAASWRAGQVHRPTTAAQVETHLRRHILPTFGRRRLSSVRPSDVQAWVADRATVLEPATVEVVYRYLSAIFKAAVEDGLLAKSPCRGIRLPKVEKPRCRRRRNSLARRCRYSPPGSWDECSTRWRSLPVGPDGEGPPAGGRGRERTATRGRWR
jgi:hypothetical protein